MLTGNSTEAITDLDTLHQVLGQGWWQGKRVFFRGQSQDWLLRPWLGRLCPPGSLLDTERRLFNEFKRQYIAQERHPKESWPNPNCERFDWDWIFAAIAQHHGLPTRLLDWSTNVEKALLFSVVNKVDDDRCSDGVLYGFHDRTAITLRFGVPCFTDETSPFRIQNVRPFSARGHGLNIDRMDAQEGVFTCQPDPTSDLIIELKLGKDPRQKWCKWIIPCGAKAKLRAQLEKKGVSLSAMFPGIDGICRHVCQRVLER